MSPKRRRPQNRRRAGLRKILPKQHLDRRVKGRIAALLDEIALRSEEVQAVTQRGETHKGMHCVLLFYSHRATVSVLFQATTRKLQTTAQKHWTLDDENTHGYQSFGSVKL